MAGDWFEPRTRIPLAGMLAMVLIVAVVAVFLKTQLAAVFPDSTVQVTSTAENPDGFNTAGRASATFEGLREVRLQRIDEVQGVLAVNGPALRMTFNPDSSLLTLTRQGRVEEVVMESTASGYVAVFEYENSQVRVEIDGSLRSLHYVSDAVGLAPVAVALAPVTTYEGEFMMNGDSVRFQLLPASNIARLTGVSTWDVSLVATENGFSGSWNDGARTRPVTISTSTLIATIEEVW